MKQSYLSFFLVFSFLSLLAFGQQQVSKGSQDSLETALDRQRADVFLELANKLKDTEPLEAMARAQQAYNLSKKINYQQGIISCSYFLGSEESEAKNYRKAARLVEEGIEAARSIGDQGAELEGLGLLQEIYRMDGRGKKLAETELEYQKLRDLMDLNRKASQLSELKRAFEQKESALEEAQTEKENIQEALEQTEEERLQKEAELAHLAQEKAELEVKTLEMEKEAAENALRISEKENELQVYNARLQRQRFWQILLLTGLAAAVLIIVLIVLNYRLKKAAEEEQRRVRQQLEMQEKMATLGQLSAGIAHEIKNPLNFVTNFAEGSVDLGNELLEIITENEDKLPPDQITLLKELTEDIRQNAQDIRENGIRADRVVKRMMEQARGDKGAPQKVDLNTLIEENIHLAYHGYRANAPGFDVAIKRNYAAGLPPVEAIPQDLGRVVLNLFNNACYALNEKKEELGQGFHPSVSISTEVHNGQAVIRLRDNGPGIPPKVRENIFQPFFTTKPIGSGNTGLGLSISHDLIVIGHQGELEVESQEGEYTEFIIRLPVERRPSAGGAGS